MHLAIPPIEDYSTQTFRPKIASSSTAQIPTAQKVTSHAWKHVSFHVLSFCTQVIHNYIVLT